jgi:hypothetical protein
MYIYLHTHTHTGFRLFASFHEEKGKINQLSRKTTEAMCWSCWNLNLRYETVRQFTREQRFIVPAQAQQTCVQRLRSENKRISDCIPLQAGYRNKKQSSTHIWLHVTSLAISLPQCYVTFFMF